MRPFLVFLALFVPSVAAATGAPISSVTVPCYPDGPFRLCNIPDADVHRPGYLPRTVPTVVTLYPSAGRFVIFVTPNVARYNYAVYDAAQAAARYCGAEPGERVVARIDDRARHAEENLESWRFAGRCE